MFISVVKIVSSSHQDVVWLYEHLYPDAITDAIVDLNDGKH